MNACGRSAAGGQSVRVSLLAYSLRRAAGSLAALLVVIWLIQFGVYHISGTPTYIDRAGRVTAWPDFLFPSVRFFQPALANEWTRAGLEVGGGLLALLLVAGAWRLRQRRAT
jgi:TRAP-type C4-dicarboxylate transport system permease small subunit